MKIIDSFKKTVFALIFCSFLGTPQSTVCLDIGISKNAKIFLICAGSAALASLTGYTIHKFREKSEMQPTSDEEKSENQPLSDEEEIAGAQQLYENSVALIESTFDTYKEALFQPIEMLELFVKAQEKNAFHPLYSFESKLCSAMHSLNNNTKLIKKTNKLLIERETVLDPSSHDLRQQYDQLINSIPSLMGKSQKLCYDLNTLAKNIVSLPGYQLEAAKRQQAEEKRQLETYKQQQAKQKRQLEAAKRQQAEQKRKLETAKRKQAEEKRKLETAKRKQAEEKRKLEAAKDFNPALTDFWNDPFNY